MPALLDNLIADGAIAPVAATFSNAGANSPGYTTRQTASVSIAGLPCCLPVASADE